MPADPVLAGRMCSQLLAGERATSVLDVVTRLLAIQAQAAGPTRLAVRARSTGLTAADVDAAITRREVVRTWLMRGTLHLVPAADARWLVRLFGPVLTRQGARRRAQLGLDDDVCERGRHVITEALERGEPLTRAELVDRLAASGIALDRRSQAPIHLISYAATTGVIVRGPDAARDEPTYVLLDRWLPRPPAGTAIPEGDDALAELARRYLTGHGPAAEEDLRAWSGLPAAQTKKAMSLVDPPGTVADGCPPRLVGHFDQYLLGYRSRDRVLDPAYAGRIQAGGGFIQPSVLVDGRVAGTWKATRTRRAVRIEVEPFGTLPRRSRAPLCEEAADVARFLGAGEADLTILDGR